MSDLIRRQNAIDALKKYEELESNNFTDTSPISMMTVATIANCIEAIVDLPSVESERTLESAINYLQSVGWLQEHDRILTESVKPEPKWIPVTEALPKNYEQTICIDSRGKMMIGMYGEYGWKFPCYMTEPVAWMPLPEWYRGE